MLKLIYSDFYRLLKNKIILFLDLCAVAYYVYSIVDSITSIDKIRNDLYIDSMNPTYSIYFIFLIIVLTSIIFCSENFSNRTINNKLICGHSRLEIYVSTLIVNAFNAILLTLPLFIYDAVTSKLANVNFGIGMVFVGFCVLFSVIISISAASISFITGKRLISLIVCFSVLFCMIGTSKYIYSVLNEPEKLHFIQTVNGKPYDGENVIYDSDDVVYGERPNPDYPSNGQRKICKFIEDSSPTLQIFKLNNINKIYGNPFKDIKGKYFINNGDEIKNIKDISKIINPCGVIVFCMIITSGGYIIFKKKDIK